MKRTHIASLILAAIYLLFFVWYTPWGGPLTDEEIEHYVKAFASQGEADAEVLESIRHFLENDTGGDFVMLNAIELHEPPLQVEGVQPGDTAGEVLDKYMAYMWPALLRRACHPVLAGNAAARALDQWGLEGASVWSRGAAMRYRSRRDMLEISTDPRFDPSHAFKIAAMKKTVAFPLDPWFHLGDPRILLGGTTLVLVLLLQLLSLRRQVAATRAIRGGQSAAPERSSPRAAGAVR